MKRRSLMLAITFLLLGVWEVNAQEKGQKGYIGLLIGSSTPFGDFASTDSRSEGAGYASTGALIDISFGYKFGKYFGIAALLRGQQNPTEIQSLVQHLADGLPSGFALSGSSTSWTIGGAMVGLYGSFPLGGKVDLDTRVLLGALSSNSPQFTIDVIGNGISGWVEVESASTAVLAHQIGAGIRYNVGRRICLLANLDYMGANPEYKNVITRSSNSLGGNIERNTFSQYMGTINFGVGVGFRL
jgi:hypothetical protein